MKMLLVFGAMLGSSTLVVFAQSVDPAVPYAKEGVLAAALGALIWTLRHQMTVEGPAQREQFTATLDSIAARDEQHHSDHLERQTKLTEAIGELKQACRDHQRGSDKGATP